jgi:hypothetical protein
MMRPTNDIQFYFHCKKCINERPAKISMSKFSTISVGITFSGQIQIWCNRHQMEIANFSNVHELRQGIGECKCAECELFKTK